MGPKPEPEPPTAACFESPGAGDKFSITTPAQHKSLKVKQISPYPTAF